MNRALLIRAIAVVVALVGLWLLLQSVQMGMGSANAYLRSLGGSIDTAQFLVIAEGYISAYRFAGAVLLAVGVLRALELPRR